MRTKAAAAAAVLGVSVVGAATAAGAAEDRDDAPVASAAAVKLQRVGRFSRPTYLTSPPGDRRRQFVVEQRGVVRVLRDGRRLRRPFLDIRRRVSCCEESGLLSLAFAPGYARSRRFYVYYTDRSGAVVVEQYRRSAASEDRAVASSRRRVLRQEHRTRNHKGGQLQFGGDGMLYVGLGDGGPQRDPARRGQDLRTLLGKILRIDPRAGGGYSVPSSNPFARRRGVRREIWAYGVRNPWRFSFTRRGSLALGDLGQNAVEEVDYVLGRRGRPARGPLNFGWSVFEGRSRFRARARPRVTAAGDRAPPRRGAACGVIGGYVVRDRSLRGLVGRYVYGDFCDTRLRVATLRLGRARGDRALGPRVRGTSSFGEDAQRRVYVMSVTGPVYRLAQRR